MLILSNYVHKLKFGHTRVLKFQCRTHTTDISDSCESHNEPNS